MRTAWVASTGIVSPGTTDPMNGIDATGTSVRTRTSSTAPRRRQPMADARSASAGRPWLRATSATVASPRRTASASESDTTMARPYSRAAELVASVARCNVPKTTNTWISTPKTRLPRTATSTTVVPPSSRSPTQLVQRVTHDRGEIRLHDRPEGHHDADPHHQQHHPFGDRTAFVRLVAHPCSLSSGQRPDGHHSGIEGEHDRDGQDQRHHRHEHRDLLLARHLDELALVVLAQVERQRTQRVGERDTPLLGGADRRDE